MRHSVEHAHCLRIVVRIVVLIWVRILVYFGAYVGAYLGAYFGAYFGAFRRSSPSNDDWLAPNSKELDTPNIWTRPFVEGPFLGAF